VFYTCLAAFFLLMLFIFSLSVNLKEPKWTMHQSIIGTNPGLSFRPRDYLLESSLIHFRSGVDPAQSTFHQYVDGLDEFLQPYLEEPNMDYHMDDYYQEGVSNTPVECRDRGPRDNEVCRVNTAELLQGGCNRANNYGYSEGRPCILIKLNKIFWWTPEPLRDLEQGDYMYSDYPLSIKEAFTKNINEGKEDLNNRVWLECKGANAADKENLGEISYYPSNGFSSYFYPYWNQANYQAPLVFIQLDNPRKGVMIHIECKAWARNIWHNSRDRLGLVQFEVMIDEP
jgi:sodium/potassium-transporting ATPase subunit beta